MLYFKAFLVSTPPRSLYVAHMAASGFFTLLAALHIVYHLGVKRSTRIWPSRRDLADTVRLARHYLGRGDRPRMNFHNPGEKNPRLLV